MNDREMLGNDGWLFGWFDATLDVEMADALDIPATFSSTVPVRIPTHPKG